jgi:hypothetical protein
MEVSEKTVTGTLYQIAGRLFTWETEYGAFCFEGENGEYPSGLVRPHTLHDREKTLVEEDHQRDLFMSSDSVLVPYQERSDNVPQVAQAYVIPDEGFAFYVGGTRTTSCRSFDRLVENQTLYEVRKTVLQPWNSPTPKDPSLVTELTLRDTFEDEDVVAVDVVI